MTARQRAEPLVRRIDATWGYRQLLRLLPASFRAEAGPDMVAVFRSAHARARSRGAWRHVVYWVSIVIDLIVTAAAERRQPHRGCASRTRRR